MLHTVVLLLIGVCVGYTVTDITKRVVEIIRRRYGKV